MNDNQSVGCEARPLPPGPDGLLSVQQIQQDPLRFLMDSARTYGDIMLYRADAWVGILVNHPAYIKRVMQDNDHNYVKEGTPDLMMLKPMLGEGLMTSEGDSWLRQRRQLQPAFHHQRVEAFGKLMTDATLDLLERWQGLAEAGTPIELTGEMTDLTTRIVSLALFGVDIEAQVRQFASAVQDMNEFMGHFDPQDTDGFRCFRMAHANVTRLVAQIIALRRIAQRESGGDLLSMLLAARNEQARGMDDRQVRDQVMTLLMAGHETTAKALTWTFYLLDRHPEVAQKLQTELHSVLGGRVPTVSDLPNLTYTWMVIQEAMRLYPPVWIMSRRALASDSMGGYHIPESALVLVSPYVMHRHPDYWPDPERYAPERFGPGQPTPPPFAYFPFSGGPRQCIGKSFATIEVQLVLATIAQRFQLHLAQDQPVEPEALVTLRPRGGLPMRLALQPALPAVPAMPFEDLAQGLARREAGRSV